MKIGNRSRSVLNAVLLIGGLAGAGCAETSSPSEDEQSDPADYAQEEPYDRPLGHDIDVDGNTLGSIDADNASDWLENALDEDQDYEAAYDELPEGVDDTGAIPKAATYRRSCNYRVWLEFNNRFYAIGATYYEKWSDYYNRHRTSELAFTSAESTLGATTMSTTTSLNNGETYVQAKYWGPTGDSAFNARARAGKWAAWCMRDWIKSPWTKPSKCQLKSLGDIVSGLGVPVGTVYSVHAEVGVDQSGSGCEFDWNQEMMQDSLWQKVDNGKWLPESGRNAHFVQYRTRG